MKHLMICREYPPAFGGGIGVYAERFSKLLAERGETVHVISQLCKGAEKAIEERCGGRLIIHRVPYDDWASLLLHKHHPALRTRIERSLFNSDFASQCFAWTAAIVAEKLVEDEAIDVIEASDYEAPLYYFQLRRALGIGPRRQSPCFVHLHSPTQFIGFHNNWDMTQPGVITATRLEDFSIRAADKLLCPSRYLAGQVEAHYGLKKDSIEIIPYPRGDYELLKRSQEVWNNGSICYVGRLERRKGVIEFLQAAISIAADSPSARFAFAGDDTFDADNFSVRAQLERSIPRGLKGRFRFYGKLNQKSVLDLLARSRISVVPSRWENFPNSCIEAMASGLPVVASREGGMAEMIEDGRTGWLIDDLNPKFVEGALRRALSTPATQLEQMGNKAASDVSALCNNDRIVDKQLEFRAKLVTKGARHSLSLPLSITQSTSLTDRRPARQIGRNTPARGSIIVLDCESLDSVPHECLESIQRQTLKPSGVFIVTSASAGVVAQLEHLRKPNWQIIRTGSDGAVSTKYECVESILNSEAKPLAVAFISPRDVLAPGFVAECEGVLERCPEVGIISPWSDRKKGSQPIVSTPCPSFPYQWFANDAASFSVIRTVALLEAGDVHLRMKKGYSDWYLVSAMMAAGWLAVTLPKVLVENPLKLKESLQFLDTSREPNSDVEQMRASLIENFPGLMNDFEDCSHASASAQPQRKKQLMNRITLARELAHYPRTTGTQLYGRLKSKVLRHTPPWMYGFFSRTTD